MNIVAKSLLLATIACAAAACASLPDQPEIASASIEPSDLKPGDTAFISVHVLDRHGHIKKIHGVVRQDPTITLELKDDGVAPDVEAGDGVWTLKVDVPFNAPPGDFDLQLSALDENDKPVIMTDERGEVSPLEISLTLVIRFPKD